jgi:hypothetical protein
VSRPGAPRRVGLALATLAALALAFAGLGACDFASRRRTDSPAAATPPPVVQARLDVSILPSPVIVLRDARDPSSRTARWTVQIVETAGVGGVVSFVNASVRDAGTGAPVEPQGFLSMDVAEIRRRAGTERLPARGSLAVPQSLSYTSLAPTATLAVAVQVVDDDGHVVGQQATARLE